jgi:glucan biosynthesis protein C
MLTQLAPKKAPDRIFFADHLRAALVILVVLHHLAVIYAANTSFYYVEPAYTDRLALVVLVLFELINQAYFMGLFFFLSGYFTPGSLERKGSGRFLKDRLLRLGIPLLVFMFVLNPIAAMGINYVPATLTGLTTPLTWQQYPKLIGIGPLWFVLMLLFFDIGYAIWWAVRGKRATGPESEPGPPSYRAIVAFILALALSSYLIRIVWPLGTYVLSFPTLAYLPQYLSFFVLGTVAFHRGWLRTIPASMGKVGLAMALGASLILFPLALLTGGANFLGGGHWQSAAYALWDSTLAVGWSLALITFFRARLNRTGWLGTLLSRHSYTVFITHAPLITFLAIALRNLQLEHLLKFGLVAIIAVPLCFAVAFLVRKIPLAARIL